MRITPDKTVASDRIALSFNGVDKCYMSDIGTPVSALENINLQIDHGQFVTLVGATGCGKTTLLNLAAGIDTPDSGTISLAEDICPKRDVAYVFQHYTLLPWLNVEHNVAFGLKMRGISRKRRINASGELLGQVGLKGYEKAWPHELSGGMRQRAAIAQALAINPRLLLMDEPFGALDPSTRRGLQTMLGNLHRDRKMTILFVTHSIDEAVILGDRVIVFSEQPGRILEDQKISLPRPRMPSDAAFTRQFLHIYGLLAETHPQN